MTPEETELWIELMEKGLAIQHAVLESKVVLDKLPSCGWTVSTCCTAA